MGIPDLLNMTNEYSAKWLQLIIDELHKNSPEKFNAKEDSLSIEFYINELQKECSIDEVKKIADKYGVLILEYNFSFLSELKSFDKRNEEIQAEGEKNEKEHYNQSKKRIKTLKIIKFLASKHSHIYVKGEDKIPLDTELFAVELPSMLLNNLFKENKALYCARCGWNEMTKESVNLEEVDVLIDIEKKEQLIYENLSFQENERFTALLFKDLAFVLHKAEVFHDIIENEGYDFNPAIKIEFDNTWATTNKSCFMVDLFVFYNIIPSYYQNKTSQEKYQYVKGKLKQADLFINKV